MGLMLAQVAESVWWWLGGVLALLAGAVILLRWLTTDRLISNSFREAAEGDFEGALERLRAAATADDPRGVRYEAVGFLCFQRARWNEAADAFERAFGRNSGRIIRRVYQAHSMARAGKVEEARSLMLALAGDRPEDVTPLCGLAMLLTDVGDAGGAAEYYWKARQLLEKHPATQTAEGIGLMEACAEAIGRTAVPPAASSVGT